MFTKDEELRGGIVSSVITKVAQLTIMFQRKTLNSIREGSCIPIEADLTTASGCKALASTLSSRESKIHVLVNNSGVSWAQPMEKFNEEKGWDRVCMYKFETVKVV